MGDHRSIADRFPSWLLAAGPVVVLGAILGVLYVTSPFGDVESTASAATIDVLWMLTIIGALAGVVPVLIGMLWFPFIRALDNRYVHAFLALSAGVLAFIAVEMVAEIRSYGGELSSVPFAVGLATVGVVVTFAAAYVVSEWRQRTVAGAGHKSGLQVAYLVAVALGLHSIGEGLAIGTAFTAGRGSLVTLLVIGFVTHNVMEGPTVVAAVARDTETPQVRHFAIMGVLAGGPVILGGWVGSLAYSPALAVLFYAVTVGAILQVLVEVTNLVRFDAEAVVTRLNAATFVVGVALMFVLEDVIVDGLIVP